MSSTLTSLEAERLSQPRPYRWSWEGYVAAAEAGVFLGQRVMLIDGEILSMSPMNDRHAHGILLALTALQAFFGPKFTYRPQLPMRLLGQHDPEPDVVVLDGPPRSHPTHPTTARLVVDVADSSLDFDLGDKASLYAAGGIPEYWVIDLPGDRLLVMTDPLPEPTARFGMKYGQHRQLGRDEVVVPRGSAAGITVAELLP